MQTVADTRTPALSFPAGAVTARLIVITDKQQVSRCLLMALLLSILSFSAVMSYSNDFNSAWA